MSGCNCDRDPHRDGCSAHELGDITPSTHPTPPDITPTEALTESEKDRSLAWLRDHNEGIGGGLGGLWALIERILADRAAAPVTEATTTGAALIAAERQRQIEVEGWTAQHDYEHGSPLLSRAARCYESPPFDDSVPNAWPWAPEWWKPKDAISNLIRAGALYRAALDVAPPLGQDAPTAREGVARCARKIDAALEHVRTRYADTVTDWENADE